MTQNSFADQFLRALAERLDVEPTTVSLWLHGCEVPSSEEKQRVMAVLHDRAGWDSGMEQAARVVRAEAAQCEPRSLHQVAETLQGLADHYPRSVEEKHNRDILSLVHKVGITFPMLKDLSAAIDGDGHPEGKAVVVWKDKKVQDIATSPSRGLPGNPASGSPTIICVGCQNPWPGGMCAKCVNGLMTTPYPRSSAYADELIGDCPVVWLTRFNTDRLIYGVHSSKDEAELIMHDREQNNPWRDGISLVLDGPYVKKDSNV